jgi:hypothetical protein
VVLKEVKVPAEDLKVENSAKEEEPKEEKEPKEEEDVAVTVEVIAAVVAAEIVAAAAEIAAAEGDHAKNRASIRERKEVKKSTFAPLFQKVTIKLKKIKNVTAKTHDIQEDAQRT